MSNLLFQRPVGTSWDFKWTDEYSTLIQSAAAPGFETRVSLGSDPIRTLELAWEILKSGSAQNTRDQLVGFFNQRKGDFDSFLVDLGALTSNSDDSSVTGQQLFYDSFGHAPIQLTRYVSPVENWQENVYELAGVNGNPGTAPVLKLNGSPLTLGSDYTLHGPGYSILGETFPGMVAIITASLAGSPEPVLTADFSWYYRMRFAQSKQEFDMFYLLLWKCSQLQLVTTRT